MNTLTPFSKKSAEELYEEYLNEWNSIDEMAENYNINPEKLAQLLASVRYAKTI